MSNEELKEALLRLLAEVRLPGQDRDLLAAGLVEEIEIDAPHARIAVGLAGAPAPVQRQVREALERALSGLPGLGRVEVAFVAASPPEPAGAAATAGGPRRLPMASGGAPGRGAAASGHAHPGAHGGGFAGRQALPGVRHLVAVASGKGGVGKSTVCVNLALALRHLGARVGLLDADIYGPSIPTMMGLSRRPQAGPDGRIVPLTSYGVRLMSLGFLVDEGTPVIWRGPMVQGVLKQFLTDVNWGELDYLMIDLPPGTGDAQLTLVQSVALSGAIVVTTPSDIALIDAAKGLNMFRTVEVPVLGVVENMSFFLCPHCGERTDVFSVGGGRRVAEKLGAPFLGEIPLETEIRRGGDEGKPVVAAAPDSPEAAPFLELARSVRSRLEGRDPAAAERREGEKKGFFGTLFSRA